MPVKPLMTWVKGSKRWQKKYKGEHYWVSPRQLGAPPTREQSVIAANLWWERKQAEIDAQEKQREDPVWDKIKEGVKAMSGQKAESVEDVCRLFVEAVGSGKNVPDWFNEAVLGAEKVREIETQTKAGMALAFGEVDTSRTVGAAIKEWLNLLRGSVAVGNMSVGRWDAYKRYIGIFGQWIGEGNPVDVINAAKLEEFWAWLAVQISEQRFSTATAKGLLMTAKQFIRRVADELGKIPLPANIDSRRLKFNDAPQKVETIPFDQVRLMLEKATERTRLFVLLMLNLGAYQADISQIGEEEVDWTAGTVTRPRSKHPKGPVVKYKLWPETLDLLKKYRAKGERPLNDRGMKVVLTTDEGKLLSRIWMEKDESGSEKQRRYDTIQSAANTMFDSVGFKKPLKLFRKTSASHLASHKDYKYYVDYFLANSPKGIAQRHYINPTDDEFFAALDWLRGEILDPKAS